MSSMTPTEYFDQVKANRHTITDEELTAFYDNALELFAKYQMTGQTRAMEKLAFYIENVPKERELIRLGFGRYVYEDDVTSFLSSVKDRVIKITDLESYERDIPTDIALNIELTSHLFDDYYVVFTDYTGQAERKVEAHRRDKDPILFGAFKNQKKRHISNRFYFLGDWVDEFCDLTFDRFIAESKALTGKDPTVTMKFANDMDSIQVELDRIRNNGGRYQTQPDEVSIETPRIILKVTDDGLDLPIQDSERKTWRQRIKEWFT